jgi:hypothetical protein
MRDGERTVVVPKQHDMICQPAEAAQHDVLVARQLVARTQGSLPFALQDRDVGEHRVVEFL